VNVKKEIWVNFVFLQAIFILSFIYFYKVIFASDYILVHGDYRYALTVYEHIQYHTGETIYLHAPKTPILMLLYPLSFMFGDILAEKLFTVVILSLSSSLVYFSNRYFIKKTVNMGHLKNSASAFIGTLVFLYNPWTINKIHHHYWLVFSLAASYALISEIDKLIQNQEETLCPSYIKIAILLAFIATQVQALILYVSVFVIAYFIFFGIIEKKAFLKRLVNKRMILMAIVALFLNLFWILPQIITIFHGQSEPGSYGIVIEDVDILSRRSSILNIFKAASGYIWGGYDPRADVTYALNLGIDLWNIVSLVPITIAALVIVFGFKALNNKGRKYLLYFAILLVISILLSTGSYYPIFGEIYRTTFLNTPLGWVIRDPYKNVGILIITLSYLFSILAAIFITKIGNKKLSLLLLFSLIITPSIWGWPALTGDLNGHLNFGLSKYPEDLMETINFLYAQTGINNYNVLWYPDESDYMIYSDVPRISSNALNSLTLGDHPMLNSLMEHALQNKDKDYIITFLNKLGVKYVILRHDLKDTGEKQRLLRDIKNFEELFHDQKILEIGNFTIYKISSSQIINVGIPTYCFTTDFLKIFKFDNVILNPFPADFVLISDTQVTIFNSTFITPRSIHHQPNKYWSAGSTNGGWLNSFLPYLTSHNIENLQLDYNNRLVFTWAVSKLNDNPVPDENDLISYWAFGTINDLYQWKNYTRGNQFGSLYTLTLDNGALKAELWNSTRGWKTLNSPLIETEYGNCYRWEFQIKTQNAHSVHVKIAEYNQEKKLINDKRVKNIGSGTFNWQTITIDYMPEDPETRYIQLQIWHGHETTQPLPNRIWIDNVKIYDLKRFIEPVVLEIPFTIEENGEYVFLTRLFQNQRGGKIQIQLDNRNYTINTKDQLNKFVWKQIDKLQLEKGNHKIVLKNLEGFNAVNLFALVPKQEYQKAQSQLEQLLQDKRIIYILEAESDLYYQKSVVTNKYGGEASNGQTLTLNQTSKAYNTIEILKPGNYTLAIRSQGNLAIKIDQKEYKISTTQLKWTYIGPLYLEKGNHTIEITSPIQQQYEWNFNSENDLYQWKNYTRGNQFGSLYTLTLDNGALKAELWNSTREWKTINSPLIPVTPETTYQFDFYVAGENAHGVHVKIAEYNQEKKLINDKRVKNIGSGNFTWKNVNFKYTSSQNASYIQLQIWHGHETTQPLPNKIWIENVRIYKYYESDLDVVWLYSTQNSNETLEDIFTPKENPAEIISYQKINPTKYVVKVNATRPFMLSFAESYDPLWVAYVNGEKIQSIPLYGVINGFWINQTGLLEITIEYEPQRWFYYGLVVSLLTFTGCVLYLVKEPLYRLISRFRKLKLTLIKSLGKGITC